MKLQILAAASALALAAAPANAVITSIVLNAGPATSSIIAAPADVQTLGGSVFYGFNEVSDVAVANPRPLVQAAPTFPNVATRIPAGTTVSSHFFVFAPGASQTISGTITFNQNVIGIQRAPTSINHADSVQIRRQGTSYALLTGQGFETGDSVTFVNDKTVSFTLSATAANRDMFSVITAVPEPASWAMMLAGFGLVGFARRRQVRAVAA